MSQPALPVTATLEVRNHSPKPLTILVDGKEVALVAPYGSEEIQGLTPGSHQFAARAGEELVSEATASVPGHGRYVWTLSPPTAADAGVPLLSVRNYAGKPVRIFVGGLERITLDPGDVATMTGIVPGPLRLEARDLSGAVVAATDTEVVGGMERVWTVSPAESPVAMIEVKNRTTRVLRITLDGVDARRLEPNASTEYLSVKPGKRVLEARGWALDDVVDRLEAEIRGNQPYEWEVGA